MQPHAGAKDEAEAVDVKAFGEHGVLGGDHVVVVVVGEAGVEAVGGFAGVAVAEVVGEDEEVLLDVEDAARNEEDVGEDGVEEGLGVAAGAVEEENGVVDVALSIVMGVAKGEVVEAEVGEGFAGVEVEVVDGVAAVDGGPGGGSGFWGQGVGGGLG